MVWYCFIDASRRHPKSETTMVHSTASSVSLCLRRFPGPQGVMRTGLYRFLDTKWASCVIGTLCSGILLCFIENSEQTCSMSQRETLLQPSRLPAANSTPEKWPGQSTFLARPAGCVGVWENMQQRFSTHSIWTHMGRWLGWNLKMFKQKKKSKM